MRKKLQEYLEGIIFKNVVVKTNNQDKPESYSQKVMEHIISFANMIENQKQHLPQYIVEHLFLQGYFDNGQYDENKLTDLFNKQYENEKVTWKFTQEEEVLIINKSIRSVQEVYKVPQHLMSNQVKNQVRQAINTT